MRIWRNGSRIGLKILGRKTYEFESHYPHATTMVDVHGDVLLSVRLVS